MTLVLSHSRITSYLTCNRAYELKYVEGLKPRHGDDKAAPFLGSAFHAGIAEALKRAYAGETPDEQLKAGKKAAQKWIDDNTRLDKQKYVDGVGWVHDADYYQMTNDTYSKAYELMNYYYPKLGIGTRYKVLDTTHFWSEDDVLKEPLVEYEFQVPINGVPDVELKGVVDAILLDTETGETVIIDWKTRSGLGSDMYAMIDNQLYLYAMVFSQITERTKIDRAVMWQIKAKTPGAASISQAKGKGFGLPNTGAASYDTTWEMWVKTLPDGIDPAEYEELMKPKLKSLSDFMRPVDLMLTAEAIQATLDNFKVTAANMVRDTALYEETPAPASLNIKVCQYCPFARLCVGALRHGGDVAHIVEQFYDVDHEDAPEGGELDSVEF